MAAASFILRFPSVNLGLPPHIFVDEQFFFDDTFRSLNSSIFFPQAFISGSVNELPFWIMGKVILFLGGDFSYADFLVFGRILGPLTLTAITVFPLYKLSMNFNSSRLAAVTSVVLFGFSPWILANSQIWYPDHYIYFFVTVFLLQFSKLWKKQVSSRTVYLLAGSFAILISVKYTAAIFLIPLLLAPRLMSIRKNESRTFYASIVRKSILYSLPIFLTLNFSILRYFQGFLAGINSNRRNYRFFTNWPFQNLIAYSELTFVFSLGFLGFVLVFFGFVQVRKSDNAAFRVFSITIATYLLVLSTSPILVPRNINLLIPLLSVIAGAGAKQLLLIWKKNMKTALLILLVITSLGATNVIGTVLNAKEIRKQDSYKLTRNYIAKNVPSSAVVGINPGSDGVSPVQDLGLTSIADPEMIQKLDYYVFNSFWESPFRTFFNQKGYFNSWSYRDFHFYETTPKSAFILRNDKSRIFDFVPDGYKIEEVIESVGPVFIIIRKVSN